MSADRVMLLIDADNVSVDIMEQAVRLLLNQHGGLHVRRAYCTAESAVSNQAAFKRLGIKPMVNLAAGKNSTDIALAVDAIDLVRMIATTRILFPTAMVRLSAGRLTMSDELQALCFLAGANSIFTGPKLLTTPNPAGSQDEALLQRLGMVPKTLP